MDDTQSINNTTTNQYIRKILNDIDALDNLYDIVKNLVNIQNNLFNEQSGNVPSYINLNGKSWIPSFDPKQLYSN